MDFLWTRYVVAIMHYGNTITYYVHYGKTIKRYVCIIHYVLWYFNNAL
jgi:hypothetical protein